MLVQVYGQEIGLVLIGVWVIVAESFQLPGWAHILLPVFEILIILTTLYVVRTFTEKSDEAAPV